MELNVSDAIIIILLSLFVTSTINERIIDFVKVQFPRLWMKSFNFSDEIKRRRRLWVLAFSLGCFSSWLIDINILEVVLENKDTLGSISGFIERLEPKKDKWWVISIGIIFSGIFISLGSKFWHDLLDIALSVKRAKRKIQGFDPKTVQDIKAIDKYLEENEFSLAQKALETHKNRLIRAYGKDATFKVGYDHVDNQLRVCIQVFDRIKETTQEPSDEKEPTLIKRMGQKIKREADQLIGNLKRITYTTEYGYIFRFPIVAYYPGQAYTTEGDDKAAAGGGLFNSAREKNIGTFGCIVKETKQCEDLFLLTCYHCVIDTTKHEWPGLDPTKGNIEISYKPFLKSKFPKLIGTIAKAYRNDNMDIALIKPHSKNEIVDFHWSPNITVPIDSGKVTLEDGKKRRRIWFSGLRTGANEGYIINIDFPVKIHYEDGNAHWLKNLIVFSKNKSKPYAKPCDKGDSGAIIIDAETKQALGMIVAADEKFGYAIPMKDILEQHGLCLYLDPCLINNSNNT